MDIRDAIGAAIDEHTPEPEDKKEELETKPEDKKEEKEEEEKVESKKEEEEKPEGKKSVWQAGEEDEEAQKKEEEEKKDEQEGKKDDEEQDEEKPVIQTGSKPPQSWKPEIRAHWSKLPAEVQAEVTRREVDINRTLTNTANARKLAQQFYETVRPYEGIIRMQNSTPMQAVAGMMRTAATLQMGSQIQKAQALAGVIRDFNIDLETLDKVLAGEKLDDTSVAVETAIRKHLAPVNEFLASQQRGNEAQRQKDYEAANAEIEAFANDPKNTYFEDMREEIADLMDLAEAKGRKITLRTAYDMALQSRPDLLKLVKANGTAPPTEEQKSIARKKVEKARAAASSISGSGAPASGGKKGGSTVRSAVEEAWEKVSAR